MNLRILAKLACLSALLGALAGGLGLWVMLSDFWGKTGRILFERNLSTGEMAIYCEFTGQFRMLYYLLLVILCFGFILGWTWRDAGERRF